GETLLLKGALAMALQAAQEKRDGLLGRPEASVVEDLNGVPNGSLAEAYGFLAGQLDIEPQAVGLEEIYRQLSQTDEDFVDVTGQDHAKRAMLIALRARGIMSR